MMNVVLLYLVSFLLIFYKVIRNKAVPFIWIYINIKSIIKIINRNSTSAAESLNMLQKTVRSKNIDYDVLKKVCIFNIIKHFFKYIKVKTS